MPHTTIETRAGWISSPQSIIDAVGAAICEAFQLAREAGITRLIEHPATHFPPPPSRGDKFTLVQVTTFKGRSLDDKRGLYRAVTDALGGLGVPESDVTITLIETGRDDWGIRGGQAASDVLPVKVSS